MQLTTNVHLEEPAVDVYASSMSATYSPEDNKLRLYPAGCLDSETYARVKAAGFIHAPKQGLFVVRYVPVRGIEEVKDYRARLPTKPRRARQSPNSRRCATTPATASTT